MPVQGFIAQVAKVIFHLIHLASANFWVYLSAFPILRRLPVVRLTSFRPSYRLHCAKIELIDCFAIT